MRKTSIVVPCYNEGGRFKPGEFLDRARWGSDLHFLFVNDGSTDGAQERLDSLSRA